MKRIALLIALMVSVSALSGCGLATGMAGAVTRLVGNAGQVVGL